MIMKFYIVILFILLVLLIITKSMKSTESSTESFENNDSKIEAYVICLSDEIYNKAKENIEHSIKPLVLNKFSAIKGSELTELNQDTITIGALYDISVPNYRRTHAELGTKNAIGCYLSHVILWKQLVESDKEGYLIFESDALCSNGLTNYVDTFNKKYPDGHILFFGVFGNSDNKITKLQNRFYGLHGYYITKKGASLLLKYVFPIEQQIDSFLSDLLLLSMDKVGGIPEINFYNINLCIQYNTKGSSIQSKKVLCNV
jgi:GR25 family glycosyltransferase involved in LPS biosynthesis